MICRGLGACTEMLMMCVLYVSFGSEVRTKTFGCVAIGSALLFIVCASEVHPVFNHVAPYGYLNSNMYLLIADITNPDLFV